MSRFTVAYIKPSIAYTSDFVGGRQSRNYFRQSWTRVYTGNKGDFDTSDKVERTFGFLVASLFHFLVRKSNVSNDYTDVNRLINESGDDDERDSLTSS